MSTTQDLNISLEPHLRKALTELPSVLPIELLDELASYLNRPEGPSNTIPYGVLHKVSLWSRTSSGQDALQNCTPPLDPRSYSMVALLAGTRTSPEKKFPAYAAKDPEAERRRAADDRKAVSTVINAVLSVAGTGFATWWASERTGLRVEWGIVGGIRCIACCPRRDHPLCHLGLEKKRNNPETETASFSSSR
ncbi:hypothetical protein BV22DRAFT_155949 [Leucogyrophana mollusca]|uniref:Uncharacterized protein n=1 Tax=Leucogyrophana mollusca TaxID=85980 RepID=A0ACB8BTZ5_9AGAM|nr:hypothetical protein BV22DRAFT_155949 [Leucogyrophana mollusca]